MLQLRTLNLQRNQVRQVVTSKSPNTALKSLDISYNKIDELTSIQYFLGLQVLRL